MKKLLLLLKYFVLTIPMGLFGMITAPIMYPIYYLTNWKWLWIYDDSNRIQPDNSFEEDYRIFLIRKTGGEKETFRTSYQWCAIRNTIWNLRVWLDEQQVGNGLGMSDQDLVIDDLTLNGTYVSDGGRYAQVAGLKYLVAPGENPWQGWVGDIIDFRYSILGQSLMFFKQDGIYSFRYSYCKKHYGRWFNFKMTCIKTDVTLHFKTTKKN